jgi:predicted Co/Zn/Cd cation transporter (cation efflux family)
MRHQETQRMWIANVFVAIVVGFFAYLGKNGIASIHWYIYLAPIVVSILCLLITLKLNHVFTKTQDTTKKMLKDTRVSSGQDWRKYVVTLESKGCWHTLQVRWLYITLYALFAGGFIALSIFSFLSDY